MFAKAWLMGLCAWTVAAQAAPPIEHWVLANGARVYFVASPELPMVDVRLVFDAGSARDGGHAGLADLTNRLLGDGADGLNADQIAQRFESQGAQFGVDVGRDTATVSLRSLSDEAMLAPALDTLRRVVTDPRFDAADFDRERRRMIVAARERQQEPDDIAEDAFYSAAYGDHPYALPPEGTVDSLQALIRDEVVAFYKHYYVGRNATLAIVGALSRERAEALAETLIGKLPPGEPAPPLAPAAAKAKFVTVEHPSTQTHILVGQPSLTRLDPDYFPLYVGNQILGGSGLVSRLFKEIREDRGLSYSVYSYFLPLAAKGPYVVGLQTKNDQAREALDLARQNLERYIAEGPTEKELKAAKDNLVGGFALRIDSNADLSAYLAVIGFYRLPLDYLDTFTGKVEAVTRDQVRAAFQRHVDPSDLATVLVGELQPG